MKYFIIICVIHIGVMCSCISESALEKALQFSGKNRYELEKVLTHYSQHSQDSLKYKAAVFLIENMPGHGWYEGGELENHKNWIDSVYGKFGFILKATLNEAFFQQPGAAAELIWKEDIQHLNSSFLIAHMDYLFEALKNRPWLQELSFSQFCEYILPYRIGYERPELWHKIQDSLYNSQIKELLEYDNARFDVSRLFAKIGTYMCYEGKVTFPYRKQIVHYSLVGCKESSVARLWYAKLLLCPVSIDFLAAHANKDDTHRWLRVVDNRLRNSLGIISSEKGHLGKIYRTTYSHNSPLQENPGEYIPEIFKNPFYKDVTADYTTTENIKVKPENKVITRYGYLCVFNDREWKPVAMGRVDQEGIEFTNVGRGIVYWPVTYPDGKHTGLSYPLSISLSGRVRILKPDTTHCSIITLEHKAPLKIEVRDINQRNLNAAIEASDDPEFRLFTEVGKISYIDKHQRSKIRFPSSPHYRYWRIRATGFLILAECYLYDMQGKIIYPKLEISRLFSTIAPAFDHDPLTYAVNNMQWDMGKPTTLTGIECLFQNNGNDIWPGDWYELSYHDGNGWFSLGVQEAKANTITFSGIPANALLWLKNLSRGKEERVFTYEGGEIRFW